MLDVFFGTTAWSDESLAKEAAHCRFTVVILNLTCGRKAAIASRFVTLGTAVHTSTDKLGTKEGYLKFPSCRGKKSWAEWLREHKNHRSSLEGLP